MYNVNPIFIISSEYYRNNYKLELIMTESYNNIFTKILKYSYIILSKYIILYYY